MLALRRLASAGLGRAAHESVVGGSRGLAWKTFGRPRRQDVLSGARRGWNIRRQLVPKYVKIPEGSWKIRVDDEVEVNYGEQKGQRGKVLEVRYLENRLLVTDVNMQTKNLKGTEEKPLGSVMQQPGPIHYSNVQLIDPGTNRVTRIKMMTDETGKRVRVAQSGAIIPYPKLAKLLKPVSENSPQTTAAEDVHLITYKAYDNFMLQYSFTGFHMPEPPNLKRRRRAVMAEQQPQPQAEMAEQQPQPQA
ncbi:translation protein SH3-like domain-containing protein [Pavlovales sp. CCMP2436]|nr:translation protein SH3-like domain-containing protein [Pavlovales sp. CCMP2436]